LSYLGAKCLNFGANIWNFSADISKSCHSEVKRREGEGFGGLQEVLSSVSGKNVLPLGINSTKTIYVYISVKSK